MTAPIPRNAFQWQDPFIFEEQLTEEERLIRDSTREFCQEKLASRILEATPMCLPSEQCTRMDTA